MEILYLLNDDILGNMKNNISIEKYKGESFIENEYLGKRFRTSINCNINYDDLPDLYVKDKSEEPMWLQDYNNSLTLHSVINSKTVPLRYLVDERFWTYLTHTKYWNYLQKRWPAESLDRIKQKWFFEGGNQVFSRHSLVRLIWIAECSYIENSDDHYKLTRIAFEFQDPINQLLERKIGKSRKVFRATLRAIASTENSFKLKNPENRTKLGKSINNLAGVMLLDVLNENELVEIISEQISIIVNS